MSNGAPGDERTPHITRRKFTLSEALDADIQRLASNHYQGNVSRCLRAAVQDHQQTVNGEGRLAMKRLERQVESLTETVSTLDENPEESATASLPQRSPVAVDHVPTIGDPAGGTGQQVLDELAGADTPLRVEDLLERMPLSKRHIIPALGLLIDLGVIIERTGEGRYTPITNNEATR